MISGAVSAGLDFVEIPPLDPETVELTDALGSSVLTGCLYTHLGALTGRPPETGELRAAARILKSTARRAAEGASSSVSRRSTATRPTSSTAPRR